MSDAPIVHRLGATFVGGGPIFKGDLDNAIKIAPLLVAADGGADAAIAAGRVPDWAIGDLDSISRTARARIGERVIHVACQNTTDFEKCLSKVKAPLVLALGFLGGRVDHELAVLSVLARETRVIVLIGAMDVVVHIPNAISLTLSVGTRVSLFPMAPVTGRSKGLEWPIDGLSFAPGGPVGTSNRALGPVDLAFDGPGMLLILPRSELAALLAGLKPAA